MKALMRAPLRLFILQMIAMTGGSLVQAATEVEFWMTQTQSDRVKVIEILAETFEALNPGVDIKVVPVEENDMPVQMAAATAAGTIPEVIESGSELLLAFGEEKILDQTGNNKVLQNIGEERFFSGALNMLRTPDGQNYYGIPFHGWIQGIWYRKDWFDKRGLAPPTTWETIKKAAIALTDRSINQYGILIGTKPDAYTEQVFTHLALANGAQQFDNRGKLVFNSTKMLETLQYYTRLARYNPPGPHTWRARDYYLQGKMGMFFYSTYIMDDLALAEIAKGSLSSEHFADLTGGEFDPDLVKNTGFAPIITHTQDASYGVLVGLSLMMIEDKKVRKAAEDFITFLYEPFAYISYLHMAPGGMNPMLRDIPNNPDYLNDSKGIFKAYGPEKISAIIKGFERIQSFAVVDGRSYPQSGQIFAKQIIPRMIYSVVFEGVSPEQALIRAEKEMKALLATK